MWCKVGSVVALACVAISRAQADETSDQPAPRWIARFNASLFDSSDCNEARDLLEHLLGDRITIQKVVQTKPADSCYIAYTSYESPADILDLVDSSTTISSRATDETLLSPIDIDEDTLVSVDSTAWNLDRIDQLALPLDGKPFETPFTGKGVTAYVIDTGLFTEHNEFRTGRAMQGPAFTNVDGTADDLNGHGTHVASTLAGETVGVARDVKVVGLKALDADGNGYSSDVIEAIAWAVNDSGDDTPAIISMSLAGSKNRALNAAVQEAVVRGNAVFAAAGNQGNDRCDQSPASEPMAWTVGATDASDRLPSWTNRGDCVDVYAPGKSIRGASRAGTARYLTMSGTSMATPLAAGTMALLLEKHSMNLTAASNEYTALMTTIETGPNTTLPLLNIARLARDGEPVPTQPPTQAPTHINDEVKTVAPTQAPVAPVVQVLCLKTTDTFSECVDFKMLGDDVDAITTGLYVPSSSYSKMCRNKLPNKITSKIRGNVVIVREGGKCSIRSKAELMHDAGAVAVVIMSNKNGRKFDNWSPNVGAKPLPLPVLTVSKRDGKIFLDARNDEEAIVMLGDNHAPITQAPTSAPTYDECSRIKYSKNCRNAPGCSWKNGKCH